MLNERKKIQVRHLHGPKYRDVIPSYVADAVEGMAKEHNFKSITYTVIPETHTFWTAEGYRYKALFQHADGTVEEKAIEIVSEHNFGATSVSYGINKPFKFEAGVYLIQVGYYRGYHCTVIHIVQGEIEEPKQETTMADTQEQQTKEEIQREIFRGILIQKIAEVVREYRAYSSQYGEPDMSGIEDEEVEQVLLTLIDLVELVGPKT